MEKKIVNLDYLNEMSDGDRNLILEMIEIFNTEVPGYIGRMKEFLDKENWEGLGKLVHKAKASASIMGMRSLTSDLKELEAYIKEGENVHLYSSYVQKIDRQFTLAIEELKRISKTI